MNVELVCKATLWTLGACLWFAVVYAVAGALMEHA